MNRATRIDGKRVESLAGWIEGQMCEQRLPYLLAYADDGVIWGRLGEKGELILSGQAFPDLDVELRAGTLQEARLFGPPGEVVLWRTEDGFETRPIMDGEDPGDRAIEDDELLWGQASRVNSGFTLMEEGERGLRHAVPLERTSERQSCIRVRHYLEVDEQGQVFIAGSRLVGLMWKDEENGAEA